MSMDFDRPFMHYVEEVPIRPVFVMGLHRCGTNTALQSVGDSFGMAQFTLYHLFLYKRLLDGKLNGTSKADRTAVDRFLSSGDHKDVESEGLTVDNGLPVAYSWLTQKLAGGLRTSSRTAELLREVCQKITFLEPNASGILLKNPMDLARTLQIRELFPEAKFIFIKRDSAEILDTQFRNAMTFAEEDCSLIRLLYKEIPGGTVLLEAQRWGRRLLGKTLYGKLVRRVLTLNLRRDLKIYQQAVLSIPEKRRCEIDFKVLVSDPEAALSSVAALLQMEPRACVLPEALPPRPLTLHPMVEEIRSQL